MDLYGLAIYDRCLDASEVNLNYNNIKAYHEMLVNGSAESGGETGGEDMENMK